MHKAVHLSGDRRLDIYWDTIDGVLTLTELVLKRNEKTIGVMALDERGEYTMPCYVDWFADQKEEDAAAAYYGMKCRDLVDSDRQTLFEEGFAREIELGPFIEKAEELAAALNQEGDDGFFVLDSEGRIIGYGEDADRAFDDAERKGWEGWVSPHSADEETALLVPRDKVRVVWEK